MQFDVIIVGGGLVGASLALALQPSGLSTAVVEPHDASAGTRDDWDARVFALSPGSCAFLEHCGVWQHMRPERTARIEQMRVYGDDLVSELDFSAYDSGLRELAVVVENRELQRALSTQVRSAPAVSLLMPATCESLAVLEDAVEIRLKDGRMLNARLVVGADGADSWVRTQAGIAVDTRAYAQTAVVANFSTALPHDETAHQWFMRDGVLALLPLPGNRVSMVWSIAEAHAEELLQLSAADLAARVGQHAEPVLGALSVITPQVCFPLRKQRVERLVKPRVALVGDAAHNVHPLAGQGVNLGFRDARALAQVMAARGPQADCGDFRLLRRYERARREDITATEVATDTLQRLFNNENTWLGKARNRGLRLTNRLGPVKNLLVRHAVG